MSKEDLLSQFMADRWQMTQMAVGARLESLLGLELTLHQLRVVLLVTTGVASTGRELAQRLHVTAPSVSASVDRLVELGFLARLESPQDRRVKTLVATVEGQRVHDQFLGRNEASDKLLSSLSYDDLEALARGTRALRTAMEEKQALLDAPGVS